jgi:uncharacterized protein YbjT (DUF2867 family)
MKRSAVLLGASGLVGRQCLRILLDNEAYGTIHVLVRRNLAINHAKLIQHVVSFDHLKENASYWSSDAVFCCLGTTIKQAGSQDAFRRVDHDYPLAAARSAVRNDAGAYIVISSIGADEQSRVFYSRVKGETERDLVNLELKKLVILRPSLILGDRAEKRWGETIGEALIRPLVGLMVGPARKYRLIQATTIAREMVRLSLAESTGTSILESDRIREFGEE